MNATDTTTTTRTRADVAWVLRRRIASTPVDALDPMDPPRHDAQGRGVRPIVAPATLERLEPLIRGRTVRVRSNFVRGCSSLPVRIPA